jgi:membrane protease YdiL (CAAX protease family)
MRPRMARPLIVKQIAAFIRSLLPPDPSQALILIGSTFLFIASTLSWSPLPFHNAWVGTVRILSLPITVAGVAGFYLCFLRCKSPVRRLFDAVLLPAMVGLLAIPMVAFIWFRDEIMRPNSVLPLITNPHLWSAREFLHFAARLGVGSEIGGIGFVCVSIFFGLLVWDRTSLPIRLTLSSSSTSAESPAEEEHRRTMLCVWLMIAMVFLSGLPLSALELAVIWFLSNTARQAPTWFGWVGEITKAVSILAFVLFAIGENGRKSIRAMLRIPHVKYLALAALVPAVIASAWSLVAFFQARIVWSYHGSGKYYIPILSDFLVLPSVSSLWYLVNALVEEIAWRGYLQPRFIRRYGLFRGIFLVGVVWGAFHFSWDFNWIMTPGDVAMKIGTRMVGMVTLSFVLAWLTIWSKSILPAAIAHGVYNMFILMWGAPHRDPWWLLILLWLAVGIALFRFFPPPTVDDNAQSDIRPVPEPEPSGV